MGTGRGLDLDEKGDNQVAYEERLPHERLQPFIKCLWRLERTYDQTNAANDGEVLWPDGCVELIFHYGARYSNDQAELPRAFLIGTLSRYHHLKADGAVRLFGVRLLPWGLRAFPAFRQTAHKDRMLPLSDVIDPARTQSLERQLEQAGPDQGMRLLEAFLLAELEPGGLDLRLLGVLAKLYREPLTYDVPAAAKESGYSLRQFERICSGLTGMPPKQLSRASRFNQARLRIFFNPAVDLHECMTHFGYYDYAHFSKDFKQCLGITPSEYQKWILRLRKGMRKTKDVVFLQDESPDGML